MFEKQILSAGLKDGQAQVFRQEDKIRLVVSMSDKRSTKDRHKRILDYSHFQDCQWLYKVKK
ncbi:MAG: hypothetical protein LBI60_04140 [Bacteroidales bacterium]|jgi:hypothetical protein|nr:hypothetical protein [Bacteroidales bacterium]